MNYTLEEIYLLVGKNDKTAGITFKYESDSFKEYGSNITVVFIYTQKERENLDAMLLENNFKNHGYVKAKLLVGKLSPEKIKKLETIGINSEDISEILYFIHDRPNTYHSKETRQIRTLNIPTAVKSKGRDFDWMYGFKKKLVKDNIGLSPQEKDFYLAGKYYYEPDNLTEDEVEEIFESGLKLRERIEYQYLFIKLMREEISNDEKIKLGELLRRKHQLAYDTLDQYLNQAGSSIRKLAANNFNKAVELFQKVAEYNDKRFGFGTKPIYMDVDGYLHIFMRHVEEMKVNKHFEHKDNFQWREDDVFSVIKNVLASDKENIEKYFSDNPNGRYSKYGDQSLYYEGDYYTFHIERDGRLSTFHKNRKKME
ncbi:hypothetical protein [Flavobacterium lindanitolerans]|uniref:hypothetical protein n=1 Tax=Flavobacterium lindanitolerans TaxID=428988 RepID=UPI00280832D3|nr:hypothetical protein [Flavobacterium lindanitolerans]MDQ7959846.1 hypothetical protein [Flavobacterium lindanitolerans]